MRLMRKLRDYLGSLQAEAERHRALCRELENLTDPTLLDRIEAGQPGGAV